MKEYSIFDILGPVMVGPSSSHTAGAARLGKVSREIVGNDFNKVTFYLHGSFAKTYRGHGTDKALVAGVLGMGPSDERIKDSFTLAKEKGLNISFIETDLGYEHPNSVKILFENNRDNFYIIGSSIGGGNILITNINGTEVELSGEYPTLIIKYEDKKGVISNISTILSKENINIGTMKVTRERKIATMIVETDHKIIDNVLNKIKEIDGIIYIKGINPLRGD